MIDLMNLPSFSLGKIGESLARFIIMEKTSLAAVYSIPHYGDLILSNGAYIEVKTIRRNKDSTFRATIFKAGSQHLGHSDFLLVQTVLANDNIIRYIIPSSLITTKRITISSKWDNYRENYELLLNYTKTVEQVSKIPA